MTGTHRTKGLSLNARAYIRRWCEIYISELRVILKSAWPDVMRRFPHHESPCHTCAFNPSTDSWPGFENTVTGLMFAIEEDRPFYCHDGHRLTSYGWLVDPRKAKLCAGYAAIAAEPKLKAVAARTLRAAGQPPSEITWNENSGLCYPK